MADLFHECGIAAIYQFREPASPPPNGNGALPASLMLPYMLLDIQNRGQLAAGISTFHPWVDDPKNKDPRKNELLRTYKDVGSVTEVFRMNHKEDFNRLMKDHHGPAGIGHVRYATCGENDRNYAQPFERTHLEKKKWFTFGFNGQLANYAQIRNKIRRQGDFHLARETDTETLMHLISQEIRQQESVHVDFVKLMSNLAGQLDGAYNIVFLDSLGNMFVSRDPQGFRPLCYAEKDGRFAAASESIALQTLGFGPDDIKDLEPGQVAIVQNGEFKVERYTESPRRSHCFFEWIYFANVCSRLDGQSVYLSRKKLGEELAKQELERPLPGMDLSNEAERNDVIVVPVPDTAKAAAEGMAFDLKVPCLEGLIRHRALGRTFIEGEGRIEKARRKYIPLMEVLEGKKVLLVDDTIVRSTTMQVLIDQLRTKGKASEVHVRIACPPIMAPCFYGIDMSNMKQLFAPEFLKDGQPLNPDIEAEMATALGADSLRYLPVDAIAKAVAKPASELCQACLNGDYPTNAGKTYYTRCLRDFQSGELDCNNGERAIELEDDEAALMPARL